MLLVVPATTASVDRQAYIGLISGVLAVGALLLFFTVLFLVRRGRQKVSLLHKHTALVGASASAPPCAGVCPGKPLGNAVSLKDLKEGPVVGANGYPLARYVALVYLRSV